MRVIQDSDDESGGEIEDEPQEPQTTNTSAVQHDRAGHANYDPTGTGSTGACTANTATAGRLIQFRIVEKGIRRSTSKSPPRALGAVRFAFST